MPKPMQKMGLDGVKEAETLRGKIEMALTIPAFREGDAKREGKRPVEYPRVLEDHVLFEGRFEKKDAGVILRAVWFCTGGKFGDFRDEGAIEGWASKVSGEIVRMERGGEVVAAGFGLSL